MRREVKREAHLTRSTGPVVCVAAHPQLNYYLASQETQVKLYQFGQPYELVSYWTPERARLSQVTFDVHGSSFAGVDAKSNVHLWKFDASAESQTPYCSVFGCHSSVCVDVRYVGSSSVLASCGLSLSFDNVCVWDVLMPVHQRKVKGFQVNETGSTCLHYDAERRWVVSGGKKGDVSVMDLRQMKVMTTIPAHERSVKSVSVYGSVVVSCSSEEVKVFDVNEMMRQEKVVGKSLVRSEGMHGLCVDEGVVHVLDGQGLLRVSL